VTAIVKLSKAAGHPVPTPALPKASGGGGGGTSPAIVFGVPVALLALGGLLAALRRRQDTDAAQA
jgi:MYXO-CTERM domain-containing protein